MTLEPINIVNLVSIDDSKITGVSLYSRCAEITRRYKFNVKTGQNQVNIIGLPNVLDRQSLRVEGIGAATIHDVSVSEIPSAPAVSTSPHLESLLLKKERTERALERCRKSLASLEAYINTLNAGQTEAYEVDGILEMYEAKATKLDETALELEQQRNSSTDEIYAERKTLSGAGKNVKLSLQASIGVFAETEGNVSVVLKYAVNFAYWHAGYDIRANMQIKEEPITLIYKAAITQNTGEAWDNVPLTLETATPTFGSSIPQLNQWRLSIHKPEPIVLESHSSSPSFICSRNTHIRGRELEPTESTCDYEEDDDEDMSLDLMNHRELGVSSKGNISATFHVPGLISIPGDGQAHNVTIVQLKLDATMSWICIPKEDARTHLKATITNASAYTLLSGNASVYVDGSFISKSNVPAVSPQESFECPLGLDPSIRITYHPRTKKVAQSGFYTKSSNYSYSQRITVFNTKPIDIERLKIVDQVPVSEDAQVVVKLINPALTIPSQALASSGGAPNKKRQRVMPQSVSVEEGVVAQWHGSDVDAFVDGDDAAALGLDGKVGWVCAVPAHGKVNLLLQWEVVAPAGATVLGL